MSAEKQNQREIGQNQARKREHGRFAVGAQLGGISVIDVSAGKGHVIVSIALMVRQAMTRMRGIKMPSRIVGIAVVAELKIGHGTILHTRTYRKHPRTARFLYVRAGRCTDRCQISFGLRLFHGIETSLTHLEMRNSAKLCQVSESLSF